MELRKNTNEDVLEASQSENIDVVIENILKKYESHPSILKIKKRKCEKQISISRYY